MMISPNQHSGSPALVARPLFALAVSLLGMISLTTTGCGPGNPLSALAALVSFSGQEFEALAEQAQALDELIEALPLVDVRIVNNTDVIAEIELQSAVAQPETESLLFESLAPNVGFPSFTTIDSKTVRVLPGGTVTGSIKVRGGHRSLNYGSFQRPVGRSVQRQLRPLHPTRQCADIGYRSRR